MAVKRLFSLKQFVLINFLIFLLMLLAFSAFGYVVTQRERIMVDHMKRVAEFAALVQKTGIGPANLSPVDEAQFRYLAQELKTEAYMYEQAVQGGR